MSNIITQEYEGRDCDITINPWVSDLSVFRAFITMLYNPTKETYLNNIDVGRRETWKHIPAIKSHIAEEITLDKCVQRLRARVLRESWQERNSILTNAQEKMGDRVPSFFTSRSLLNMGGLAVHDQYHQNGNGHYNIMQHNSTHQNGQPAKNRKVKLTPTNDIDLRPGWGGMGLKGNHSMHSLNNLSSAGSGLFYEGDEDQANHLTNVTNTLVMKVENVKTTSMANFYYKRSKSLSQNSLQNGSILPSYSNELGCNSFGW